MRLNVLHETQYSYSNTVLLSRQLLHLAPRALDWQDCERYGIETRTSSP